MGISFAEDDDDDEFADALVGSEDISAGALPVAAARRAFAVVSSTGTVLTVVIVPTFPTVPTVSNGVRRNFSDVPIPPMSFLRPFLLRRGTNSECLWIGSSDCDVRSERDVKVRRGGW